MQRSIAMYQEQPATLKEIRTHGTKSFPCAIYRTHFAGKGTLVKSHWHDEIEILHFSGGDFQLKINMDEFPVHSECLYFINPGELHSITTGTAICYEDAVVFSPDILRFDACDATQIQLLQPIQKGKMLFPRCILPSHPAFAAIRDSFSDILRSSGHAFSEESRHDDGGVAENLTRQLYIKSSLLRIFAILSEYDLIIPAERNYDKRVEDIKTVLTYIRENYKEKIYIADLAAQISLNEQYFCRFFRKVVGHSPMEYVSEYRIRQSCRLLDETNLSVMEICLESGYNNLGNFLREFRKRTGTTPLQYRRKKS